MKSNHLQDIKVSGHSCAFNESKTPNLSVLLPTYNRSDALNRTLHALENQTLGMECFEIIVVDDGSTDNTVAVLSQFTEHTAACLSYAVLRENGGPARARNVGLAMCRGQVVLIIGDDIEPDTSLLESHFSFHRHNFDERSALLGHVSFPEGLKPNGFMRWLEKDGRKYYFNFYDLKPEGLAGPIFFYTCNVSVKMSLLEKSGWFDESFPYASHEDLELGYRLADNGMQLVYNPKAEGYHWHMLSVQGVARRVYLMGHSAVIFWQKVDDEGSRLRRVARQLIAWGCVTYPVVLLWNYLCRKSYREERDYPLQWKVLLFLSFFIGLADSQSGRSLRL